MPAAMRGSALAKRARGKKKSRKVTKTQKLRLEDSIRGQRK
jgi:hypothetical protein